MPCSVTCAYWTDLANADLTGDGEPDVYFDACVRPFPPGSYDDHVVKVPEWAGLFEFWLHPLNDWAGFLCTTDGKPLATGVNLIGDHCDNLVGPNNTIPLGCGERTRLTVGDALDAIVMRAYNWLDIHFVWGRYRFIDLD